MNSINSLSKIPAIGCLLGTAYQILLSRLTSALKEAGLNITTSEYLVLRAVYCREGLQQCEIADMVGKDKAAICRCVAGLAKKGLVRTESVSHKCLRVYASEEGRRIEPDIMKVAISRHKELEELISPEELEVFTNVLEKIVN